MSLLQKKNQILLAMLVLQKTDCRRKKSNLFSNITPFKNQLPKNQILLAISLLTKTNCQKIKFSQQYHSFQKPIAYQLNSIGDVTRGAQFLFAHLTV